MWSAILRILRVAVAQGISALIVATTGITIPYLNIGLGAVISGIAKFLRDKFPSWGNWLPV